jgi:mono/diheme cytochrome c family protein
LFCHTAAAGYSLGLDVGQMNRRVTYPGDRPGDQLATLAHVGVLELDADPRTLPALPAGTAAPLEARARAYLHANCSFCHRPAGGARGFADLRWEAADMRVCDAVPVTGNLGIAGARLVAPGSPERSILSRRMHLRDGRYQMPPLGSLRVDADGAALIDAWITATAECP